MPRTKEITAKIEDKPGALGKCFLALGDAGVTILAFQSFVEEGESEARFLPDDIARATSVLGGLRMVFEQTEVVTVTLKNRPGALGRAASRLGESRVNIDYSYSGPAGDSGHVVFVFGVDNLSQGAAALDALAAEDAKQ